MTDPRNRFLRRRGEHWYYRRRVPKKYAPIDPRTFSKVALNTDSLSVARQRRDAMASADDAYWASKLSEALLGDMDGDAALAKYQAARELARAKGFEFLALDTLVVDMPTEEIVARIKVIDRTPEKAKTQIADVVLGGVEPPRVTVSQAMDLYLDRLALGSLAGKSDEQKRKWAIVKRRCVASFVDLCGDLPMDEIERKHARAYYDWWGKRIAGENGTKPLRPNSANRDLGNLRTLYREYYTYLGDEERPNPFRSLRFSDTVEKRTPPFETEFIRTRILAPGMLDDLNDQARDIVYAMIETGCRPSEICNLLPENIRLDCEVPHIKLRATSGRQLKTKASARDIPLVGVSLDALRRHPEGFPRYRDKSDALSQLLMKAFKARKLLPTDQHRIYSLRHSFEDRMLEAGLDYGLRCLLMGHKNTRPQYGDGGSLAHRRKELIKCRVECRY
ncbi:MAG: DUF6538 domain-containing protein [Litorimonas sp.]